MGSLPQIVVGWDGPLEVLVEKGGLPVIVHDRHMVADLSLLLGPCCVEPSAKCADAGLNEVSSPLGNYTPASTDSSRLSGLLSLGLCLLCFFGLLLGNFGLGF